MNLLFLGGTGTVTGSKYLLETKTTKILIDCGMYQGYKWLRERNREALPFSLHELDAIVLTHAHLDHSGFIPVLYKQGFRGKVFTHKATTSLCSILLPDSGHIQEDDAKFYGKHKLSKHQTPEPLYDKETAEKSLALFESVGFHQPFQIGDITVELHSTGHILGAASAIVKAEGKTIGFSGDVGRPNDIVMYPPEPLPKLDLLLLESTYGNRLHEQSDVYEQMQQIVLETAQKGGVLLIPSFAVGRTETVQHILATLMAENKIPKLPVYLDSPMAISVFDIYCNYGSLHRLNHQQCHQMCDLVQFCKSVDDSKALADVVGPHIIIAGSGMATGGRILHHMKRLLGDHRTTLLFTGFLSGGTRGAKLLNGDNTIKIHGEWIPVRAKVDVLHGLSGHGDYQDLTNWLQQSDLPNGMPIKLVHGEPDASEFFKDYLLQNTHFNVEVAGYQKILRI